MIMNAEVPNRAAGGSIAVRPAEQGSAAFDEVVAD
jgi:hypothetical protein